MKKNLLKIVCLMMSLLMVMCLFGCGDKKGGDTIHVAYYMNSTIAEDIDLVEEEVNRLVSDKIGAKVELIVIPTGSYNDQINLMMTGNEPLDLFIMKSSRFSSYVSNGQCVPLDDLLKKYGKDIIDTVGEKLLQGGSVNGEIYGIMPYRDVAQGVGFFIRKDYVDKYNIDIESIKTMDDVEKVLATIKKGEPSLYPLIVEKNMSLTPVELMAGKDNLSDGYGVLPLYEGDFYTVYDYYSSDAYRESVTRMNKWYKEGYISPDASVSTENIATQMKAGTGVCYFYKTKTGIDAQESKADNTPMVHADLRTPCISTAQTQTVTWGIAVQSTNPTAAMKFLNLLYSDRDLVNVIDWGIEGKHYVHTADGHINYPEGIDSSNSGYNINMSWAFGKQFLSEIWVGNDLDVWEQAQRSMDNAVLAPTLGFTYDASEVSSELAVLDNVVAQYRLGLETGSMDPSNLDDFIAKLQTAGIQRVIDEKQRQLNEWLKINK